MLRTLQSSSSWFRQLMMSWVIHRRELGAYKFTSTCAKTLHSSMALMLRITILWVEYDLVWCLCLLSQVWQSQGCSSERRSQWRLWRWQHRPAAVLHSYLLLWLRRWREGECLLSTRCFQSSSSDKENINRGSLSAKDFQTSPWENVVEDKSVIPPHNIWPI